MNNVGLKSWLSQNLQYTSKWISKNKPITVLKKIHMISYTYT